MTEIPKMDLKSMDIAEDKKQQLKQIFPEVFTEKKIDFEKLKSVLGEMVETGRERYGMNWPGKADCMKIIQRPSVGTLKPCPEESVDFDNTENLFIEGDNLEVLKLLQKSYYGKIKMIYIDPPYNTGNDFVYPDNYSETLDTYLKYTGQVDDEGNKFSTNVDTDGRFHSKWLTMMYPRLYLARNLLKEDGVIFISIDDNECDNLKKICNEIFGEENFVANVIWEKKYSPQNDAKWFSANHDHILVYSKSKEVWRPILLKRSEDQNSRYTNRDNDPRGPWKSSDFSVKTYSASYDYTITTPSGRKVNPPKTRCWRTSKEKFNGLLKDNRIWFGENGDNVPSIKRFLSEVKEGIVPLTIWKYSEVGHNQDAAKEIRDLFNENAYFDTPKPTRLLKRIIELSIPIMKDNSDEKEVVLDFFSGSSSTAHAVLSLNKETFTNRRFILIQLPEIFNNKTISEDNFKTIADIGKERIRRVIKKIKEEKSGQLDFDKDKKLDLGFKVFKLDKSNFKVWDRTNIKRDGFFTDVQNDNKTDENILAKQLELHIDHINPKSSQEDILYELLLKAGFPLTTKIEKLDIENKTVFSIDDGALFICLEKDLSKELMSAMADQSPKKLICLDAGFHGNDQLKTNAVQIMKTKEIEFRTV